MRRQFFRFVSGIITLGLLLVGGAPTHPVAALDPFEYFSVNYSSTVSRNEVIPGQSFDITVTGTAVCIKDLPFSPKTDFIHQFYTHNQDILIDKKGRVYNRWSTGRRRTEATDITTDAAEKGTGQKI